MVTHREVRIPGFASARVPIYERSLLCHGDRIIGPAIVRQMDSTTVMLEGQCAEVADGGDLLITESKNGGDR